MSEGAHLVDRQPGERGQAVVEAWPEPVQLGEAREVGREPSEAGEQLLDERVLVGACSNGFVLRSRPMVVVRSVAPGAEQNDPAPWVG